MLTALPVLLDSQGDSRNGRPAQARQEKGQSFKPSAVGSMFGLIVVSLLVGFTGFSKVARRRSKGIVEVVVPDVKCEVGNRRW